MVTATKLAPPVNDPPLQPDGTTHSDAWRAHNQNVADEISRVSDDLTNLPAQMRKGVTDGSDAQAGDIGEQMTASAGGVALTSAATTNVVSLSLTAGDWDVQGNVVFSPSAGTNSFFGVGMSGLDTYLAATFAAAALNQALTTATRRYNVTAATTVWVVARAVFTGTCTAAGSVMARRMR